MLFQFVNVKKDNTRLRDLIANLQRVLQRSTMSDKEAVTAAAKLLAAVPRRKPRHLKPPSPQMALEFP